jgi:hypothetical protein
MTSRLVTLLILSLVPAGNLTCQTQTMIDPQSVTSLSLKIIHGTSEIGSATGFVLTKNNRRYLVTNRHVVLACSQDQEVADVGGWICANKLLIFHNQLEHLGSWIWKTEDLFDASGKPRWLEHPTLKGAIDIIALPLLNIQGVQFYPLDIELAKTDVLTPPGDSVSIVGFPFGLAQYSGLPVWKNGTIASDMDINFQGKSVFLVDATTRPGMSGSPVYAVRSGFVRTSHGMMGGGGMVKFLGIYSEQIPAAEIGGVWKAQLVRELYDSLP